MISNVANSSICLKRIQKDYQELKNNPVKGVGIIQPDESNPYFYILNLRILTGKYDGLILAVSLKLPKDYPITPPKALVLDGQGFSHSYHHHIFGWSSDGLEFCIDLLDNKFGMNTKAINSGWTSAYTLKATALQLQNFLADPDMPWPSKQMIDKLFEINKKFTKTYKIGNQTFVHTYNSPFPEIYGFEEKTDPKTVQKMQLQEKITCYFTKTNPLTDKKLVIGYPIDIKLDFKGRVEPFPIPEIVSYTGYTAEGVEGKKVLERQLKTAYGQKYNYWMPIYVSDQHYVLAKENLEKATSVLFFKDITKTIKDFYPQQYYSVFPALLCKMVVFLLNGTRHSSIAAIEAFCHYILTFKKMIDHHNLSREINGLITGLYNGREQDLSKKSVPDIGNFIVLLFFSRFADLKDKKLINKFLREYFARQVYWMFQANEKFGYEEESNKTKLLRYFMDDPNILKEYGGSFLYCSGSMRNELTKLKEDLEENKEFFKTLFYKYSKNKGKKFQFYCFMEKIFQVDLKFTTTSETQIFSLTKSKYVQYKQLKERIFRTEVGEFEKCADRYGLFPLGLLEKCTLISKRNIMRQIFDFAKVSNQLLIFTFLTSQTFINPEFIEKLESNYGVIETEDAESFISKVEELKRKVDNYDKILDLLGMQEMKSKDPAEIFYSSCCQSNRQGYTRTKIPRHIEKNY